MDPLALNLAFQQAMGDIERGYQSAQDPSLLQSEPERRLRSARRDYYNTMRMMRFAKMIKRGADDVDDSIDLAFHYAQEPARADASLGDVTYTTTPSIIDAVRLRETSRESNTDGRSVSTFLDEFERELEQDKVENEIPDQRVGPPGRYAQKMAYLSDSRREEESPQTNRTHLPAMEDSEDVETERALETGHDQFDRWVELNKQKSMYSSLESLPHGKTAELDAAYKLAALKYRQRVEVFIVDDKNRVLAGRHPEGNVIFPGGGVEDKEELLAAGKREALEEVGRRVKRVRKLTDPVRVEWSPEMKKDDGNGAEFVGSETIYLVGRDAGRDVYLHGADDGFKMRARFRAVDKLIADLKRTAASGHPYAVYDQSAIDALKKLQRRLKVTKKSKNVDIEHAFERVQNGPADLDRAFKEASRTSGQAAFDDRGTTTETAQERSWSRRDHDPFMEEEWRDQGRSRNIEQSFREFDAPQTQEPHNFETLPAGGL
jgi:hypothetical protein